MATTDIYPPDMATPVGVVRLLVPDLTTDTGDATGAYMFSDGQLAALLALYNGSVKRAAARAIEIVATDQALLTKVIRTDDLSVNGAVLADSLLKQAKALREDADNEDSLLADEAFVIAYEDAPWYIDAMNASADIERCAPEATPVPWNAPWR